MRLGRAAAYAIFAVVFIAREGGRDPVQGKDISKSCGMPGGRLLKILQQLVRARILASERGPSGGFHLRKPPEDISVLEIVEAIQGSIEGELVVGEGILNMDRTRAAMQRVCAEVAEFARARLRRVSIRDLAASRVVAAGRPDYNTGVR